MKTQNWYCGRYGIATAIPTIAVRGAYDVIQKWKSKKQAECMALKKIFQGMALIWAPDTRGRPLHVGSAGAALVEGNYWSGVANLYT